MRDEFDLPWELVSPFLRIYRLDLDRIMSGLRCSEKLGCHPSLMGRAGEGYSQASEMKKARMVVRGAGQYSQGRYSGQNPIFYK